MEFLVSDFTSFFNKIKTETAHDKVMYLSLFIDSYDDELKKMYLEAAEKHNTKIMNDPHFYDAGFDLYLPKNESDDGFYGVGTRFFSTGWADASPINKVDFKVKCCAKMYDKQYNYFYTPFYTYARSSMSKTPLRLANNQGIIDAGYRGNLIGMFDCLYSTDESDDREQDYYMDVYSRMLQICAPSLVPIYVQIVSSLEELGPNTSRGEGGFGSTGK
jgi:dUTP pyrophosphatase